MRRKPGGRHRTEGSVVRNGAGEGGRGRVSANAEQPDVSPSKHRAQPLRSAVRRSDAIRLVRVLERSLCPLCGPRMSAGETVTCVTHRVWHTRGAQWTRSICHYYPRCHAGGGLTDVCTSQEVCRALYPLGTGSLLQLPLEEDGVGQSKASRLSAGGTPSPSDCGDRPGAEVGRGAGGGAFC